MPDDLSEAIRDLDLPSWFEMYIVPGFEQLPSVERDGEKWRVRSR